MCFNFGAMQKTCSSAMSRASLSRRHTTLAHTPRAPRLMLVRHPPRVWLPLGFTTIYRNGNGGAHSHSAQSQRFPISALVTAQVPSIGRASSAYHMRDPRRPPRRMETGWALRFRTVEKDHPCTHGCFTSASWLLNGSSWPL